MPATYCDRHPSARAAFVYTHGGGILYLCGHCGREHQAALADQGWTCDPVTQPARPAKAGV